LQENIKIGSIVKARSRLWRVDDINDEIMEATPIDGLIYSSKKFLIPIEKISPAKIEFPDPNVIGIPAFQDLLIRSYRLSLIHGTAPILCLQRSRIIPEIFQLVPVVMALEMPRVRMLIADDVGLGKTIEAGLIVTELLARKKAKKVLVICPASLRDQWKETLSYSFILMHQ
jgi:SNF2 family DNA or RNA helicase